MKTFPVQLQRNFEADLVGGEHAVGSTLGLFDLGEQYGVRLLDIETVVKAAVRKGLLKPVDSHRFRVLGLPTAQVKSLFQHAQHSGQKPTTVIRSLEVVTPNQATIDKLQLAENAPVWQQVRTRLVNGIVLANQHNYIPFELCPELGDVDLSQASFQTTLEKRFNTVIVRINETYTAGVASREDAKVLDISLESSVLVVERMSYGYTDMPLVWATIVINPAHYEQLSALWPDARPLLDQITS